MTETKTITLKVTAALVLTGFGGPDRVSLSIEASNPFPKAGYSEDPVTMEMTTEKGFGAEWCETNFGIVPEIRTNTVERGKFSRE